MSSTSRDRHAHTGMSGERTGVDIRTVEAIGTTAMHITHSSAGCFFHLGGLSWSKGTTNSWCVESYTLQ